MRAGRLAGLLLFCLALPAAADYLSSPDRQNPPSKDWPPGIDAYRAQVAARMLVDFGEQYLYAPANAALPPPRPGEKRVVFLGDSITDRWDLAKFFPGQPYVNRGIGAQVTPQMLVRFQADVAALHPAAVVILGGVNDLGTATQVESDAQIEANYQAMATLAAGQGIKPIFTAVLPLHDYGDAAKSNYQGHDPKRIDALNRWLAGFCAAHGYGFIDYRPVLRDGAGKMKAEFSADGLHPNDDAYAVMAPLAKAAIEKALR